MTSTKYYKSENSALSFFEHERSCHRDRARPIKIESEDELSWIVSKLSDFGIATPIWTDLFNLEAVGILRTSDWKIFEHENGISATISLDGGKYCVEMEIAAAGILTFSDQDCSGAKMGICELDCHDLSKEAKLIT